MVFSLRIDLESDKGIREGVPKILDLLAKHNIKASFYLVMGGESNLVELLKYQEKLEGERKIKVFTKMEMLRMVFLPRDFVSRNKEILKRIIDEGHELGIHGWKHREWTRGLDRIDIQNRIGRSVVKYERIFGKKPKSFCAPSFRTNSEVLNVLSSDGIKVISDFGGDRVKNVEGLINVPVTILGKNKTPFIESLSAEGFSDEKILEELKLVIRRKNPAIIYIHCLFECREKIELLDNLFSWLKKQRIETKRIIDIAGIHEDSSDYK